MPAPTNEPKQYAARRGSALSTAVPRQQIIEHNRNPNPNNTMKTWPH